MEAEVAISRKTILRREQNKPRVEGKPKGLGVKQVSQHREGWTGAEANISTHISERRLVMLVLDPWRYSQGAVQQLCKCQRAQEVIGLVPKAPWKWNIEGRVAWVTKGMVYEGLREDVHPRWWRAIHQSELVTLAPQSKSRLPHRY